MAEGRRQKDKKDGGGGEIIQNPKSKIQNGVWWVICAALHNIWDEMLLVVLCNLLWVALTLLLVTGPPATMALFYVAGRLAHDEPTDLGDFLWAMRRYFGLGWLWGLINGVMVFLLAGDVILTGQLAQSLAGRLVQGAFLTGLAVWLLLQLYVLPFLFEQETPSLSQAFRNGAVMLGANISFSLSLGLLLTLVLLAGGVFFLVTFAIGAIFLALAGNHAVISRLAPFRKRKT